MTGSEQISSAALRALATNLDGVKSALEAAGTLLEEAEVGGAAFSKYGLDLAVVYPSAQAFAVRDAESKAAHVQTIQERLNSTARVWEEAEQASTIAGPR